METNENVNEKILNQNVQEAKTVQENVNSINTGGCEEQKEVDMQATQRITILEELRKDTEKITKTAENNQQGNIVSQTEEKLDLNQLLKNEKKEIINIPNSSSENPTEPIARAENHSAINISENDVQKNPNQLTQETKIENTQNDNLTVITEVTQENNNVEEISQEKEKKDKEKQHAQDKKDYRLEKMLFDRINKMQGKIKESLELIKKFERINAKEENLPNIVTTLHDKLTHEVIKQFRTVGIEFNMKSYLVQAVVSDLLNRFEDGITEFKDCSENLNFVKEVQEDFESRVELAPTSKVKNFFARLRGMFKPERKQEKLEQLERERQEKKLEEANIHLIKYKFINSELERYTIKRNLVSSLTKETLHGIGSGLTLNVTEFIKEKIAPEIKLLGLENSLSDLEEKLYTEYREKHSPITKEEFFNMPIGEVRKNMKIQKTDVMHARIGNVVTGKTVESDDERIAI